MSELALLAAARRKFHLSLLDQHVLSITNAGIPSNADKSSKASVAIATGIYNAIGATGVHEKLAGQTSGNKFEHICAQFVDDTFTHLGHLRPGRWSVVQTGGRNRLQIAEHQQYEHLIALDEARRENPQLAAILGSDYTITPDILVAREPESDDIINSPRRIVEYGVANKSGLRESNNAKPILHASVSCKWTIRSDRAQNSRSEALNLIRNRKGSQPHIVVITGEPFPSRIGSIAMGTGDIDCVYHFALHEMLHSLNELPQYEDARENLEIMVNSGRLKDISDLPLDLAV